MTTDQRASTKLAEQSRRVVASPPNSNVSRRSKPPAWRATDSAGEPRRCWHAGWTCESSLIRLSVSSNSPEIPKSPLVSAWSGPHLPTGQGRSPRILFDPCLCGRTTYFAKGFREARNVEAISRQGEIATSLDWATELADDGDTRTGTTSDLLRCSSNSP